MPSKDTNHFFPDKKKATPKLIEVALVELRQLHLNYAASTFLYFASNVSPC